MSMEGKIVQGYGFKSKKMIRLFVVSDMGSELSGKVISEEGRLTGKADKVVSLGFDNFKTGEKFTGGWEVLDMDVSETAISLSGSLRRMDVGDTLDITKQERNVDVVRSLAARVSVNMDRKYVVNRTPEGCTITRKA